MSATAEPKSSAAEDRMTQAYLSWLVGKYPWAKSYLEMEDKIQEFINDGKLDRAEKELQKYMNTTPPGVTEEALKWWKEHSTAVVRRVTEALTAK